MQVDMLVQHDMQSPTRPLAPGYDYIPSGEPCKYHVILVLPRPSNPQTGARPRPSPPASESKLHQSRIQHQRQQEMKHHHHTQRPNRRKGRDLPVVGDHPAHWAHATQHGHGRGHDKTKDERELELAQDPWHLVEEGRLLGLLARRTPRHVDGEHMGGNRLRHVDRDTAEEDGQQGQPGEVLKEGAKEAAALGAVAQDGEADGAEGLEDDDDG